MIITTELRIKVNFNQLKYYQELGYVIEDRTTVVNISDLPKGSGYKVNVCCDICGKEKEVVYKMYNKVKKRDIDNLYYCSSCAKKKTHKTIKERYDVDYIPNKIKKRKLERYNDENYNNLEKCKKTKLDRYGNEYYNNLEKGKQTCLEKYGVDNITQTEKWKQWYKNYCLDNYGCNSYLDSEDFKIKRYESFQKYKNGQPLSDPVIRDKIRQTLSKNGFNCSEVESTDFAKYKRKVIKYTNKIKDKLYENWDGYDYYDNEYIRENKNSCSNEYPSIDHKISISYGYKNQIPPEIIGGIDNLCITKRILNSKKNFRLSEDFKKLFS